MAEFEVIDGNAVINETNVETSRVLDAFQEADPEVAALIRWRSSISAPGTRQGSLVQRDRYVVPGSPFEQMRVAYFAAERDDVVGGVLEGTESLAFSKMTLDTEDEDQTDIWNQIATDLELEKRIREMWRENFIVSQVYSAVWWGVKSYKVGGRTKSTGTKRKKQFANLTVPLGMSILDPLKVVPVGNHMLFNRDMLAYWADGGEYDMFNAIINGDITNDPLMSQLLIGRYEPDAVERRMLGEDGLPTERLFLLNPQNVWRHTDTKSQYQRFATIRLLSIFELLDLKSQLRAMDRSLLLAGTNFITVIKKGDKDRPAKASELQALTANVRTLSRVPVIIGDDRLSVEIVTPKTDNTLSPERYNGIDSRITSRLYQLFSTGNYSAGAKGDDSIKLAKMVGKGLEARRHLLKRSIEKFVLNPTYALNEAFEQKPVIRFHPKRIALDFDPTYANFILDLLDRGHISRESGLEEVDYDQQVELRRRRAEKEFDDDFAPRSSPGSPAPTPTPDGQARSGGRRQGGLKNGGGAAPGSGQGQAPADPSDLSDDK